MKVGEVRKQQEGMKDEFVNLYSFEHSQVVTKKC